MSRIGVLVLLDGMIRWRSLVFCRDVVLWLRRLSLVLRVAGLVVLLCCVISGR